MKKILLTLLFVMLTAVPVLTHAWYIEAHYDAVECAICGKTVYVWQEASFGPYMPSLIAGGPTCPGELACRFIGLTRYVCSACELNYSRAFSRHIESFYIDRRFENIKLIEKHQEKRKQEKTEERKNRIIQLEEELEGLRK